MPEEKVPCGMPNPDQCRVSFDCETCSGTEHCEREEWRNTNVPGTIAERIFQKMKAELERQGMNWDHPHGMTMIKFLEQAVRAGKELSHGQESRGVKQLSGCDQERKARCQSHPTGIPKAEHFHG